MQYPENTFWWVVYIVGFVVTGVIGVCISSKRHFSEPGDDDGIERIFHGIFWGVLSLGWPLSCWFLMAFYLIKKKDAAQRANKIKGT